MLIEAVRHHRAMVDEAIARTRSLYGLNPVLRRNRRVKSTYHRLVDQLRRPGQDPRVLAEALDTYLWAEDPADAKWLVSLLAHRDARVRENAIWAVTELDELCADESVLFKLVDILERDGDPSVRLAAAAGLFGIYDDDPDGHPRIADAIVRLRADPLPDLRAKAILTQAAGDTDSALLRLLDEFATLAAPWQMVHACTQLGDWPRASPSLREKARARLMQLQLQGWAQRYVPGGYPDQQERTRLLTDALSAIGEVSEEEG